MIEERRRAWIAAVTTGDVDAYADIVTEDVVWLPPHGATVVGRNAFRTWLEPFLSGYDYEFSVDELRTRESDRWIAETGVFHSRMTPRAGGSPATHTGRYLVLWRRDADTWRIERYVDLGGLGK